MVENKRNFQLNPVTTEELINCRWYAVANDTIGGWDVATSQTPDSVRNPHEGEFEVGCFLTKEVAEHIAAIHNKWWEVEVWKTYMPNIFYSYKQNAIKETQTVKSTLRRLAREAQNRFDRSRMKD